MADCCRGNVEHLAGLPKLGVALAFERKEENHLQRVFLILGKLCLFPLQPFSQQMVRAMNGLHIEVKVSKA